jgi:3-polyprenyl-4-hydroxybenzoate decarboxylase
MCGNATLATDESSTTMKVAIITDAAIIHGFAAGFQSRCAACNAVDARAAVLIPRSDPAAAAHGRNLRA